MFEKFKQRSAERRWMKSPIGGALQESGYNFFWNDGPYAHIDENSKLDHCRQIHALAMSAYTAADPILAIREQLSEFVLRAAQLMVIGLTPEGKLAIEVYNDSPFISATLHEHIDVIAEKVDELGMLKFQDPSVTSEDLRAYCTTRASLHTFYANSLNMVSIDIEQRAHSKSEWYRAFTQAAMVSAEDSIRDDIGLPSLLPGSVDGLVYSNFMFDVINGEPDPLFSWTKRWPDHYLWGHGPKPVPPKH
jgi:hypothetical protein